MTFEEYCAQVGAVKAQYPSWRYGQTYFNVLVEVRPDLTDGRTSGMKQGFPIRGSSLDPFYNDLLVPDFLREVERAWNE